MTLQTDDRFMKRQSIAITALTAAFCISHVSSQTFAIDNIPSRTPRDVWISADRGNRQGRGTRSDPYDGSTAAKLDTILRNIGVNTTVHFGPGAFETVGSGSGPGFHPKSGCKYIGAGMAVTTIKLAALDGSNAYGAVFDSGGATIDGVEVRDMTIDTNGDALLATYGGDFRVGGVNLKGRNCVIENVRLIHEYGHQATGREAFGLAIESTGNGLIKHCLVDSFAGGTDYGQMIGFTGSSNGGIIKDCEVVGQTTNTSAYVAYGSNITLSNCRSVKCRNFLYMDTGNVDHVTVRGCRAIGLTGNFINCAQAAGFSHHDILIEGCVVDFTATGGQFFGASAADTTHVYNVTLTSNVITQSSGNDYIAYNFASLDNFREYGNRWRGRARVGRNALDPSSKNYNIRAQFRRSR